MKTFKGLELNSDRKKDDVFRTVFLSINDHTRPFGQFKYVSPKDTLENYLSVYGTVYSNNICESTSIVKNLMIHWTTLYIRNWLRNSTVTVT